MTFDEADLIAFHNGTLPAPKTEALLRQLENDENLALRLMRLDPAAPLVAESFGRIEPPALELPESGAVDSGRIWKPLAITASLVATVFAVGTFAPPSADAWHRQVAAYQVLYTKETVSMISRSDAALTAQFDTLEEALAIPFDETAFADIDGIELLRAQLLGFEGAPLGQIVFADLSGRPIALCMMEGGGDAVLKDKELAGLSTVSWGTGAHRFLLVGPVPAEELRDWAAVLQDRV